MRALLATNDEINPYLFRGRLSGSVTFGNRSGNVALARAYFYRGVYRNGEVFSLSRRCAHAKYGSQEIKGVHPVARATEECITTGQRDACTVINMIRES